MTLTHLHSWADLTLTATCCCRGGRVGPPVEEADCSAPASSSWAVGEGVVCPNRLAAAAPFFLAEHLYSDCKLGCSFPLLWHRPGSSKSQQSEDTQHLQSCQPVAACPPTRPPHVPGGLSSVPGIASAPIQSIIPYLTRRQSSFHGLIHPSISSPAESYWATGRITPRLLGLAQDEFAQPPRFFPLEVSFHQSDTLSA